MVIVWWRPARRPRLREARHSSRRLPPAWAGRRALSGSSPSPRARREARGRGGYDGPQRGPRQRADSPERRCATLLAAPDTGLISPQRLSHLVRRGAALAEITPPPAARPLYGINPAMPFAGPIATAIAITTRDAYAVSS